MGKSGERGKRGERGGPDLNGHSGIAEENFLLLVIDADRRYKIVRERIISVAQEEGAFPDLEGHEGEHRAEGEGGEGPQDRQSSRS